MKTDDLIAFLSERTASVDPGAPRGRLVAALGWGAFGTTLMMALMLGVRADVASAIRLPMFWLKLALPVVVALAMGLAALRLSCPGGRLRVEPMVAAFPVAVIALLALDALLGASPAERVALVLGSTWRYCLVNVTLLSLPPFAAIVWAMRGLAPTRLALAGGVAGLLAGAIGESIYALHCPEMAAPFLAVFYVGAMAIPALAGVIAGPRLLRW
jgi:hypothetical protein